VEGLPCSSELEALVVEARLIRAHEPKYNRRGTTWRGYAYLKIDPAEVFPRIKVVRRGDGGATYLGPFPSSRHARLAKEALEDAFPIRRCTRSMRASTRFAACALAEMGRCTAPCDGRIGPERYGELVRSLISSLSHPGGLLEALEDRMRQLATHERFEEAAQARDRLRTLTEALLRRQQDAWLLGPGRLVLRDDQGRVIRFEDGELAGAAAGAAEPIPSPCPRDRVEEVAAVRSWLQRNRYRVEAAEPPASEPADGAVVHRLLARLRVAERPEPLSPRRTGGHGRTGTGG
jgi:DNA polymerase-3 subunit epsilon